MFVELGNRSTRVFFSSFKSSDFICRSPWVALRPTRSNSLALLLTLLCTAYFPDEFTSTSFDGSIGNGSNSYDDNFIIRHNNEEKVWEKSKQTNGTTGCKYHTGKQQIEFVVEEWFFVAIDKAHCTYSFRGDSFEQICAKLIEANSKPRPSYRVYIVDA